MNNIGFIGTGNMGGAIIKGILNSEISSKSKIFACDLDKNKLAELEKIGVTPLSDAMEVCQKCKYVFLAVKPQMFEEVLAEIKEFVTTETVLISIAAGISSAYIKSQTIAEAKVVLVMPNTPLLLGEGATALSLATPTSEAEFKVACDIFSACGEIAVINEDKMKEIIPINGSSPAFIYLFAKGFIEYAKEENIDEELAKSLFAKTLIGSAKMITSSGYSIDDLITMVSSPGGTTLKGLEELNNGKLLETIDKACKSCTKRAYELSK